MEATLTELVGQPDPIGHIFEDMDKIIGYVFKHRLVEIAGAVWHLSTPLERRVILRHLADQVLADRSPYRRFFTVRDEMDAFDTPEEFVDMLSTSREMGVLIPTPLYPYIALYVDTRQGKGQEIFTPEAFIANYLAAHNGQ